MAYVEKRPSKRGKAAKWTMYWVGADGKKKSKVGTTNREESQKLANHLESEATMVREGLVNPAEKARRTASLRPIGDHVEDYRLDLVAKETTAKHSRRTANALAKLLIDAGCPSTAEIAPDKIRAALGRLRAAGRSARTVNFHATAVKAFAKWLEHNDRIEEVPRGLAAIRPYNEKEDRRLIRRAITREEAERLLAAAEAGEPIEAGRGPRSEGRVEAHVRYITGPERAALYRLAMGTGFRAEELRTLTPERFQLDGDSPTITVLACYAKNGKEAIQPVSRELAGQVRPFVTGKAPGKPILTVPVRTAKMLRVDLARAQIAHTDAEGRVVDFHSLRGSFITHLVNSGANPKVVQTLARHSTITLTLDRYTSVERDDVRKALEGDDSDS